MTAERAADCDAADDGLHYGENVLHGDAERLLSDADSHCETRITMLMLHKCCVLICSQRGR